ncbi:MAG: MerR family transcriptional regulator [Sphingobacteriales bacterium]|nr:MAG: MerR family transcriptional regulator [Sphingobacteriales bacterium]
MSTYSIKELEVLTGIKAHTIRIWEQRYNILAPNRTDTNIRFYTEEDLKHLLNISLLNKNGLKISRIAKMNEKQVKEKVLSLSESNFEYTNQIDSMVVGMIEFDEESFEKIISTNILRIGFENTFLNIVFPFLHKIGILWQTAVIRPAQEHFISNLIRQKLIVAIDGQLQMRQSEAKRCMLFLPEREMHELGLLFMNYVARSRGINTLYLGASVPFKDVEETYKDYLPHFMITLCVSHPGESSVQSYIENLGLKFPDSHILISGRQALSGNFKMPENVILCRTMFDAITFLLNEKIKTPEKNGRLYPGVLNPVS